MKKLLILLFIFLLLSCSKNICPSFGQDTIKWYQITKKEIQSYLSMSVSGSVDGINQAILFREFGKGNKFWDQTISWKNKYRDFDNGDLRAKYPGSKTYLVWTTDGYHLTRSLSSTLLATGVTLNILDLKSDLKMYRKKDRWKVIVFKKILVPSVLKGLNFELMFKQF